MMEGLIPCCAGLDVHERSVVACVRRLEPGGQTYQYILTFETMMVELQSLADWSAARGVTQVAMEPTGVDWKPVYNLVETRFTTLVVDAPYIKQVPGRKTDVKDCQWNAQWLQRGLPRQFHPAPVDPTMA
jgi:transposase